MATRAERFKASTQRKGEGGQSRKQSNGVKRVAKAKKARAQASAQAGAGKGGKRSQSLAKILAQQMPAEQRRYGGLSTGARNETKPSSKATAELEDSLAPSPPSRKSTRRSANHVKAATPLTARHQLRMNSPAQKHEQRRR